MNNKRAVVLMSGGLDSLVALDYVVKQTDIEPKLAITFDYGQKAASQEIKASVKVCDYYGLQHEIINLDWLKSITKTALVSDKKEIPSNNLNTCNNTKSVWVPNRNSLFLNIAGCFCDSFGYEYIVYGANKDEAEAFPDNTEEFRAQISKLFRTSTLVHPQVLAPLINYTKNDIVRIAVDNSAPLELVWSCYSSEIVHCGKCESCRHLKNALIANHCGKYIKLLFNNEN